MQGNTTMDSVEEKTSVNSSGRAMSRLQVYKNLLVIGLMNMLQYSVINPTNALVTSAAGKTLGNVAYSLNYLSACIFTILSIPVLNSQVKEKEVLWINNIALVVFAICNWYISYFTLITASFFHGLSVAVAYMVSLVYINKLAVHYAEEYKLSAKSVISLFSGIMVGFTLVGYIIGNGTASLILTLLKSEGNDDTNTNFTTTNNGSLSVTFATKNYSSSDEECHTNDDAIEFTVLIASILRGVIVVYSLLALVTTAFLDDFDKYHRIKLVLTQREKMSDIIRLLWPSLKHIVKIGIKRKMYSTYTLFIAVGISNGFIFSSYTKVYVSECIDVEWVGYIIMAYAVSSSLGGFATGKLLGLVNYNIAALGNLAIHIAVMLFLIIWEREPNYAVIFTVPSIWGLCFGAWLTITISFVGTNFGEDTQVPYGIYRVMHMGGIGTSSLLAFMPLRIYQILMCTFLTGSVLLHLIVKRVSS